MKKTLLDAKHNWYRKDYENGGYLYLYSVYEPYEGVMIEHSYGHNPEGPSYYSPFRNYKEYKIHGKFHRLDGPASEGGAGSIRAFYIAGVEYDELSYWTKVEELKQTYPKVFEINGVKYSEDDWWTPV